MIGKSKDLTKMNLSKEKLAGLKSHPKLQLSKADSSDSEAERMFDLINENAFEELCELTKDDNPFDSILPSEQDLYYKGGTSLRGASANSNISDEEVNLHQKPLHKGSVKEKNVSECLNRTPFKLSVESPEACAQKTAYFGHAE